MPYTVSTSKKFLIGRLGGQGPDGEQGVMPYL